jgi:hypothetical protein
METRLMTRSDFDAEEDGQRPPLVHWQPTHRLGARRLMDPKTAKALAVGATAVGALAVSALAIGAIAVGAMAIGKLAIGKARIRKLHVDELTIGSIRVLRP